MPHGKDLIFVHVSLFEGYLLILQREPPPLHSRPEGANFKHQAYTMSEDTALFQPPPSYPEAPKNMYYQVPATKPEPQRLTQLFPWETHAPKPTRVFAPEQPLPLASPPEEALPVQLSEPLAPSEVLHLRAPFEPSAETWESYSRSNAWDEDPHIQRYIESIQQARHARTQVISGSSHPSTSTRSSQDLTGSSTTTITETPSGHRPSIILTDFPTEVERPSLPVTPAPIQRNRGIGGDGDEYDASGSAALPAAEGVPSQQEWVGVTVDAFSQVLRATYLLWRSTESPGQSGRTAPPAVRGFGASGAVRGAAC
jgi:hypothetical protein